MKKPQNSIQERTWWFKLTIIQNLASWCIYRLFGKPPSSYSRLYPPLFWNTHQCGRCNCETFHKRKISLKQNLQTLLLWRLSLHLELCLASRSNSSNNFTNYQKLECVGSETTKALTLNLCTCFQPSMSYVCFSLLVYSKSHYHLFEEWVICKRKILWQLPTHRFTKWKKVAVKFLFKPLKSLNEKLCFGQWLSNHSSTIFSLLERSLSGKWTIICVSATDRNRGICCSTRAWGTHCIHM